VLSHQALSNPHAAENDSPGALHKSWLSSMGVGRGSRVIFAGLQ